MRVSSLSARVALLGLFVVGAGGCDVPTPLAPAEPIGAFPTWGEDFATPKEQPQSALGPAMGGAPLGGGATGGGATGGGAMGGPGGGTSSAGQAMPGAIKDFSGGDAALGKGIYQALCTRCHGAAGEGGALPGNVAVPALADAALQGRLTDAQMARGIALGKGAMPSFMQELDRDKLAAVIAYVRTLKR